MNRPTMLACAVISDLLMQHKLPANKDLEVVQDRVRKEGDSFLAITLPTLGSGLEAGLERGLLLRSDITSFGHDKNSALPKFLGGLWKKIFSLDGMLLSEPDYDAIYAIRQIAYFMKKPKSLSNERRNRKAIRSFRRIEEDLANVDELVAKNDGVLRAVSDILWRNMFCNISNEDIVCRHGPGATSERKSANSRFQITHWNQRSQDCFPMDLHCIPNYGHYEELEKVVLLSESQELPVRVVQVPKTMKGPRTIAIEPSHVQYMQQGLMSYVVETLENHELTRDSVRFSDQQVNKLGAQRASVDKRRATLDMSDASDRVHNELVKNIFQNSELLPYLQSCRSTHAKLPDSEVPLKLRKFASMGSAMCFPVEAMVFYTLIQVALHYYHNEVPSKRSILRFSSQIDVYGDDIIVPTYSRRIVQTCLEALGLKVNHGKSFSDGFFRESCGGDYYSGYDVTPVYLRHLPPAFLDHSNPEVLESLVSTSNQLYSRGLWLTCQTIRDLIKTLLPRKFVIPRSRYVTAGLTYLSKMFCDMQKFSVPLNCWLQHRIVMRPSKKSDPILTLSAFVTKTLTVRNGIRVFSRTSPGLTDTKIVPTGSTLVAYLSSLQAPEALDHDQSVSRGVLKLKRRWFNAQQGILVS